MESRGLSVAYLILRGSYLDPSPLLVYTSKPTFSTLCLSLFGQAMTSVCTLARSHPTEYLYFLKLNKLIMLSTAATRLTTLKPTILELIITISFGKLRVLISKTYEFLKNKGFIDFLQRIQKSLI